ncbi:MAG: hypothetical protein R6X06_04055 [Gammaproteobacteria bacterium]
MKGKTNLRYLGSAMALGAMLLPLSSQADVSWSITLGHGLPLSHNLYQPHRYQSHHHKSQRPAPVVKHHGHPQRHHKEHRSRHKYGHHYEQRSLRASRYYPTPAPYGFIPRHRPWY